jgi:hypothetical protein
MHRIKCAFARALALAAVVTLAALGTPSASAQPLPSGDRFQGFLSVEWGDPRPGTGGGGHTHYSITYPDGTEVPLDIAPELRNVAVQYSGKRVTVRGRASAESGATRIRVDSIEAPEGGSTPQAEAVIGTRKVLFVLLRYKGDLQQPHPPAFFTTQLTNPLTPPPGSLTPATINGFFNRVSYGKFKWVAHVVGTGANPLNPTGWMTLPQGKAAYANCGWSSACFNSSLFRQHALALVAARGVDINNYHNINFVINNDLDCCAWGGSFSNGSRSWGATYEPPWGQEAGVYVHEMGHSLGLPHSGWRYHDYDSSHDQMSRGIAASSMNCGSYKSANTGNSVQTLICDKPGGGFIAVHQDYLGWIPAANKRNHSTVSTRDYIIEANSAALGTRLKLVRVCIKGFPCAGAEGTNARFITVEVKLRGADFDNGVPSQGVVIHDVLMNRRNTISGSCYFNNQSGWAVPFDAMPGDWNAATCTGEGLVDMAYGVGKTFITALGVKVEVISKAGNTFRVRVTKTK